MSFYKEIIFSYAYILKENIFSNKYSIKMVFQLFLDSLKIYRIEQIFNSIDNKEMILKFIQIFREYEPNNLINKFAQIRELILSSPKSDEFFDLVT